MANPMPSLPPTTPISLRTVQMAGLLVDVYGLAELAPTVIRVSCLWLHHPRTRSKGDMADVAARFVAAWNSASSSRTPGREKRGLIALVHDQRNHGSRLVDKKANGSWREGNPMHAVDMFAIVQGMVADQRVLLDLVEAYLFHDANGKRKIDQHLALGVSLGGHSVWQLMFADPRVTAGVVVIGCPDFMNLLSDRARLSRLSTYSEQDDGASFLGSRDFPPSLVETCKKLDPKAIFFGTSAVPETKTTGTADEGARQIFRDRLRGKKFLLCSGADDKLVPYSRCSEPFLQWFKQAAATWAEEGVSVDDRVYQGVGHSFSTDMVADAVQFVLDVVGSADQGLPITGGEEQRASKI
ncbi:hypothetical protein N657DRAFT_646976 [Parathielavia appendiculata]|uniref:Uncharacterized protein n=1 Tax=Parathielavia appendiculata TaxID=2587402 RepID=A0AAN6TWY1_9PEZI|nr:hypothetical protein N657DRAFT_646976 [Parathielavia appendiculata]